jgi:hypothetical protein
VGSSGLEPPTSRLSGVRSNRLSYEPPSGGDEEIRTPDPLLARQVLSQLSYTPIIYPSDVFKNIFRLIKVAVSKRNYSINPSKLNSVFKQSQYRP